MENLPDIKLTTWDYLIVFLAGLSAILFANDITNGGKLNDYTTPLFYIFIIGFFFRIKPYIQLRSYNGRYRQFELDFTPLPHKISYVSYPLINLLIRGQSLIVTQRSDRSGDWDSLINISFFNPYICSGFFEYIKSGSVKGQPRGGQKGDWGLHTLHLNPNKKIIHVQAQGKSSTNSSKYLLIPENDVIVKVADLITDMETNKTLLNLPPGTDSRTIPKRLEIKLKEVQDEIKKNLNIV